MNKTLIWNRILPILFVALILVIGWAYQPTSSYEECLQTNINHLPKNVNAAIRPNPIHQVMMGCIEGREMVMIN